MQCTVRIGMTWKHEMTSYFCEWSGKMANSSITAQTKFCPFFKHFLQPKSHEIQVSLCVCLAEGIVHLFLINLSIYLLTKLVKFGMNASYDRRHFVNLTSFHPNFSSHKTPENGLVATNNHKIHCFHVIQNYGNEISINSHNFT